MAYQNIAGVEPHPSIPGASIVRFRDGSFMPAPSGVAAKFDPNRQAIAQNATLMSEPGPMASTMPEQSRPAQAPSVPDVGPRFTPAQQPAPQYPPPPSFSVPAPAQQPRGELIDRVTGLAPYQLERQRVYSPGRAAYDPETDNASRRAVRESQTEQRSGQQAWDEEAQLNNVINQRQAIQAKAEADNLAAQSNLEAQRMYAQDLQSEAQAAAAAQRAEEERWRSEQMRLSDEAKSVAGETVNPNRVFSAAGPFQMIGLAVAAALKGYATKGTDTSVIDNVQRIVDRDVALQEQQISRKKGEIDNALYRNTQRYGSIEAGRSATKAQQLQAALARFDANKARIGINAQTAQIEAQRQALEAAVYGEYEQAKMLSQGTTTTAVASSMRAPQAGIAPSSHMEGDREYYGRLKSIQGVVGTGADIVGKQLANEGKDLENQYTRERGATPEQLAALEKDRATRVAEYGQRRDATEAAVAKIERFFTDNKIGVDKKGNVVVPDDLAGFGSVVQHLPNRVVTREGVINRATINEVVAAVAYKRFGAYNPVQGDTIREELIGDGRPETIAVNLNNARLELKETRDNLSGSFSPDVIDQYEKNKSVQRQRSDDKSKYFKPVNLNGK